MKSSYTKTDLVKELSSAAAMKRREVRKLLDTLQAIIFREAGKEGGFSLPGICKFDVVRRKERKLRNPQTGETLLMAAHDTLRVRALKKARMTVTPPPENLITVLKEIKPDILDDFSKAVSFRCTKCGQEIEAPAAAIGMTAQCPACGTSVVIPKDSEPGTMHGPALPTPPAPATAPAPAPAPALGQSAPVAPAPQPPVAAGGTFEAREVAPEQTKAIGKSQTIRIDLAALGFDSSGAPIVKQVPVKKRMLSFFCKSCHQEIEAPAEMAGTSAECPSCGASFEVPFFSDAGTLHGSDLEKAPEEIQKEAKARTIRIEVPDE
jgi:DNA-binding protein HU-beta